MVTEAEKIQAAFDRMFDLEVDARFAGVRASSGIREADARVSGDPAVCGISNLSTIGMIKMDGSAPLTRITESDLTTASFSYLLGTNMNKRLLHDYLAFPAEWRRFCTAVPIKDFKQQTRVRLGAFGSLSTVNEDTAYTTLTLADAAATYSASKREEGGFSGGKRFVSLKCLRLKGASAIEGIGSIVGMLSRYGPVSRPCNRERRA